MSTLCPLFTYAADQATYTARAAELVPGDAAIVTGQNSGPPAPGEPAAQALMQHIAEFGQRDVTVLGYVTCGRGLRSCDAVFDDIDRWWQLGVPKVFMDEWPEDWPSMRLGRFWGAVRAYAGQGSLTHPIFVANPGRDIVMHAHPADGCLVVTYESDILTVLDTPRPWEAVIVHSQPPGQLADIRRALRALGYSWIYVTDDVLPNPYDGIRP